jgi:hypothetical protein
MKMTNLNVNTTAEVKEETIRVFKRELNRRGDSFEVLTLEDSDIHNTVYFEEGYLFLAMDTDCIDKLKDYMIPDFTEIGGGYTYLSELEGKVVISDYDYKSKFVRAIWEEQDIEELIEDGEFTNDEYMGFVNRVSKQIEQEKDSDIKNLYSVSETYEYWDGSNHQTIVLSGGDYETDWQEITHDEDYKIKEEIERVNCGTGHYDIVILENGDIYKLHTSYYAGLPSVEWERDIDRMIIRNIVQEEVMESTINNENVISDFESFEELIMKNSQFQEQFVEHYDAPIIDNWIDKMFDMYTEGCKQVLIDNVKLDECLTFDELPKKAMEVVLANLESLLNDESIGFEMFGQELEIYISDTPDLVTHEKYYVITTV